MKLVINADDLGIDRRRDDGILAAFKQGKLSHASLLVNGPDSERAAMLAKAAGLPLGLHLDLTETPPVADAREVRTLVDSAGRKHGKWEFFRLCLEGAIAQGDVRRETVAQVEKFRALTGAYPSHIDGHNHVHVFASVAPVLVQLAPGFGARTVRIPTQRGIHFEEPKAQIYYDHVCAAAEHAHDLFRSARIRSTEAFFGLETMGARMSSTSLENALRGIRGARTAEWMTHPGFRSSEGDAFNSSPEREHELNTLLALDLDAIRARVGTLQLAGFSEALR
jgi:chitin disaccharide deacetylase